MKIVVFTGAGISRESGIPTFRDVDGLYTKEEIEKMVTLENFKTNPRPYYDWINERKSTYGACEPNAAHIYLKELEDAGHEVTIITQNVDDLHEKAGSTNILHLHGEINKSRYVLDHSDEPKLMDQTEPLTYDESFTDEGQLRPHIVLFGEMPYNVGKSYNALDEADIFLIIGTSMSIGYTHNLIMAADNKDTKIYYIDPQPAESIQYYYNYATFTHILETAVEGVKKLEELCQLITKSSN